MSQTPARQMLEEALRQFREALIQQGVYDRDHQNLEQRAMGRGTLSTSC